MMIELKTTVNVRGISGKQIAEFMLYCTDEAYQAWWPGTHLQFHTIQRTPGEVGSLVYFDEHVGKRRLKFRVVITEYVPGKKIVWQMRKGVRLPARLVLDLEDTAEGVLVTHTMRAGFGGIGKALDPLLWLYLSPKFEQELAEHAEYEFPRLAEILEQDNPITSL